MLEMITLPILRKTSYSVDDYNRNQIAAQKRLDNLLNRGYEIVTQQLVTSAAGEQITYVLHKAPKKKGTA